MAFYNLFQEQDVPQEELTGLDKFARSPWMNAASQNMNNMAALRRNQLPQQSSTQAYQQAVAAQAASNQNRKAKALEMQKQEQALDPFFSYKEAKAQGIVPATMTYAEFQNISARRIDSSSAIKNMEHRTILQEQIDNAPDETSRARAEENLATFDTYVRAPQMYGGGVGDQYRVGPSGMVTTMITPEQAIGNKTTLTGATTGKEEEVKTNAGLVREGLTGARESRLAYQGAQVMLDKTNQYLEMFDNGTAPETGFAEALMLNVFGIGSEKLGSLNAATIESALRNLGITNLAPVTEQEFSSVMQMWADISKSPEVNKGALQDAKARTERLMEMIQDDAIYNAGLVQEYGTPQQVQGFMRSNSFVRDLLRDADTGTDTTGGGNDEPSLPDHLKPPGS